MANPRELAQALETEARLPSGREERFSGYGVMGLPFASGHVLGLRRFPASSVGPGYTSVWHRDPEGRWTFYQDVPPLQACPRYFGSALTGALKCVIRVDWTGPYSFSVAVEDDPRLEWEVTLAATLQTRAMNAVSRLVPSGLWRQAAFLTLMGVVARGVLGTGNVGLTGRAPNGQRFVANPRLIWTVAASRATVGGTGLGAIGPLLRQARLGDFWIPQRGLFVIGGAYFEPYDPARHLEVTSTVGA
ncbi:MAG TPA: hypothetical protein VFT91_06760 [Dehalococcoidia bacterium]|nr:hypothetical protein [Dehalococcoidia bacterium]